MTPESPITPPQNVPPTDQPNLFQRPWYLYFIGISRRIGVLADAAMGWASLTHQGRLVMVTEAGAIGEARWSESEVVGMRQSTQANLAALAATLAAADAGLLVEVTDYAHILRWDGSGWEWGPKETGGGQIYSCLVDPSPTTGWQLCDGTQVDFLLSDGTLATTGSGGVPAIPDLVTGAADAAYLKLGDTVSGPNAATAPGFTDATVDAASTGISTSTGGPTGSPATTTVQSGTGATVASSTHQHAVSIIDPTHTHTVTGATVGDDGEPRNFVLRPWFRR